MKICEVCGGSMQGKRPHAKVCSKTCKNRKADRKRWADPDFGRRKYIKERERRLEYGRNYHKTHPEVSKQVRAKRRARKLNAQTFTFTEGDWNRLVNRYKSCCAYCGERSDELQKEHVIPLSRGGSHGAGNILPACPTCNYRKGPKLYSEFRYRHRKGVIT